MKIILLKSSADDLQEDEEMKEMKLEEKEKEEKIEKESILLNTTSKTLES